MNLAAQFQQSTAAPNGMSTQPQPQTQNGQFSNAQFLFQQQQQQQQQQRQQQASADRVIDGQVQSEGLNPSKLLSQGNIREGTPNSSLQQQQQQQQQQPSAHQLHNLQQQLQQLQLQQLQHLQQKQGTGGGVSGGMTQQTPTPQSLQNPSQIVNQVPSQQSSQPFAQQLLAQHLQSQVQGQTQTQQPQFGMNHLLSQLQTSQTGQVQAANQQFFEPEYKTIPVDQTLANSVHWKHQTQLAFVSRKSNASHFYARQAASSSRKAQNLAQGQQNDEDTGSTLIDITKSILTSVVKQQQEVSTAQALQAEAVAKSASGASVGGGNVTVGTPTLSNAVIAKKTGTLEVDAVDEEEEDQRIRIKENNTQLWTGLDLSGQMMCRISDKLFRYSFLRRLYLNGNNLTEVPASIGSLKSLRVLDISSNKLTSLPKALGTLFNLRYFYLFDNDIREIPTSFGNMVSLEFLGIEGNTNMDKEVINTIAKKGTRGLIIHFRDDCIKLDPPESRKWIEIGEDGEPMTIFEEQKPVTQLDLHTKEDNSFTLMSYNTLCQHYATPKMYKYTPSWALNWEYRRDKLTEEIIGLSPNIICLQEVETRTYEEYWVPLMLSKGYKGTFHCKSRAKTMSEKGAKKVDGCATFYQSNVFELIDKRILEYGKIVISQEKFKKTDDVFNRFMNKDNIASVSIFQHTSSGKKVVIANTHLHWDPEYNDVKAMQVAVLLEELQAVVKRYIGNREDINKIPVVICGDFNSQMDSAVYQFFSDGNVRNHGDLRDRDYGKYTSEGMTHPFHLRSAYDIIGELPFTNFTPTFTEVIDYIWYSTATLSVKGVLSEPDRKYTEQLIGFPTADCPSDHIPLVTRFEFKRQGGGGGGGKRTRADFGSGGSRKT